MRTGLIRKGLRERFLAIIMIAIFCISLLPQYEAKVYAAVTDDANVFV